jgi:uncharacterized protein HemX
MSKDRYGTTEKHVLAEHPDGTVERTVVQGEPVRERIVEPRVIKVKSGGGAAWAVVAVLAVAVGGLGWYILDTREEAAAVQQQQVAHEQQQLEQEQQQAAMEQRLEDIGQRAAELNAEVRDAQRDMGVAPPAPGTTNVQPAIVPAPAPAPAPTTDPAAPPPQ